MYTFKALFSTWRIRNDDDNDNDVDDDDDNDNDNDIYFYKVTLLITS